jgi:hypothetical protein
VLGPGLTECSEEQRGKVYCLEVYYPTTSRPAGPSCSVSSGGVGIPGTTVVARGRWRGGWVA